MKNLIAVLFNKKYISFFMSQLLGVCLSSALVVFLISNIADLENSLINFSVLVLTISFLLPIILFSSTIGQIVEIYSKDKIIKIVSLLQFIVVSLSMYGWYIKSSSLLILSLVLEGFIVAISSPTKFSAIAELVEHEQLVIANSIIQSLTYVLVLVGAILGAYLSSMQFNNIASVFGASSIIIFLISLFIPQLKSFNQKTKISFNFIKTFKDISFFGYSRDVYLCAVGIVSFWFIATIYVLQVPNFASIVLNLHQNVFMLFLALFTVGIFFGALLAYFLLKKTVSLKYVPISVLIMTVFTIDFAFSITSIDFSSYSTLIVENFVSSFSGCKMLVDLFMFSLFLGVYIVSLVTMLEVVANRKIRSRVFCATGVVSCFAVLLAIAICAILKYFDVSTATLIAFVAVFNVVCTIYVCSILPTHLVSTIVKRVINIFYTIDVEGMENFEKCKGGTLIIANHTSLIDGIILYVVFGERLSFAINTGVANKFWVKRFLKLVKYFPVDNTNVIVVKSIIDEIKKGGKVVIFPEGRITTTGGLMKVYPGPAVIADKSNADILPICIEGIQYSDFSYFGSKTKSRRQRKIKLTVLPPRKLGINKELSDSSRRNLAMTKLYDIMCEMKFASNFSNKTIFSSLIDTRSLIGRSKEIIEDINREPLNLTSLFSTVFSFAHKIKKQTVSKEYVGLIPANSQTTMELFFALSATNRVPVMINYTDTIEHIIDNVKNVGVKTVYASHRFIKASKLENIIDVLKQNNINVIFVEEIKNSITIFNKISAYIKSYFPNVYYKHICDNIDSSLPAVVMFTSAFKGKCKSVVLTHKNIQASRAQFSSVMDFGIMDSFFNTMPIFNSLGFIAGTLVPLLRGIKVFLYHSPLHYKMVSELVYDTSSTVILGTNTFLEGYAKTAHPFDFYAIRYVICGIEKLKEETAKIWEDNFGKRIFEAYGTTETSSTISVNTPMYFRQNTVGRLMPSVECRLESTTAFVSASHLLVKGPNVADYYIENGNLVSNKKQDDWFDTGDIVEIDRDGFVYMKGKSKRFTKVDGESVSLTEVEFNISNIWKDSKNALLAVSNNGKKEIILFTTNKTLKIEDLQKVEQENNLENFVVPNKIVVLEQMPITGTGVTDYLKLKDMVKEVK